MVPARADTKPTTPIWRQGSADNPRLHATRKSSNRPQRKHGPGTSQTCSSFVTAATRSEPEQELARLLEQNNADYKRLKRLLRRRRLQTRRVAREYVV